MDDKSAKNLSAKTGEISRRRFITMGLGALTALAALEAGAVSLAFLRARSLEGEFGETVVAGEVSAFAPGTVTEFTQERFFLVRATDGGFLALYRRCPHLGCNVNWDEEMHQFHCPCHASKFDVYGDYCSAPVPRPLDLFAVQVAEQRIVVDTSQVLRRERFEDVQLVYA